MILRHAFRALAKMFRTEFTSTLVTIVTLALAIGANTTIFSVANALLLKPTPGIVEPQQLVNLGRTNRGSGFGSISYPDYLDYRDRNTVFTGVAATTGGIELGLRHGDVAERVSGLLVSENLFEVMGTIPAAGRFFDSKDGQPGAPPVAVISHNLWTTQLGGDPTIAGKEIVLNGRPVTVIGVAPEGFHGPVILQIDVFLPLSLRAVARPGIAEVDFIGSRSAMWLTGIARLKRGVTIQQAGANMAVLYDQIRQTYRDRNPNSGLGVFAYSSIPGQRTTIELFLTALMSIVGLVLLIACANIAGIGLARAASRRREVALRLALGAGRLRIIRQLLTETIALFAIGGAGGMIAASWITDLLYALRADLPVVVAVNLSPDPRVLLFTLAITLAAALVSGLTPALSATRTDIATALKEDSMTATGRRSRLRPALVVAQVSLSVILLIAGALFFRTVMQTDLTRPGFDPAGVQVVSLDFFTGGYNETRGQEFGQSLLQRVNALPGVESASLARDLPLDLNAFSLDVINVEGHLPSDSAPGFRADWNIVSPGYFRTLRLPLLRGRDFTEADRAGATQVAIINQNMANRFWPGEDPIGKSFYRGATAGGDLLEVIGVARDTQNRTLDDAPGSFIYVPLNQAYNSQLNLLLRTAEGADVIPADVIPMVRRVLSDINPDLPVINIRSMSQVVAFSLIPQRVAAWIIGCMGLVGLLLASIGIYGVTAHAVSSRTREIGIRVALGARPSGVLRLVLREGLVLSGIGIAGGLVGALGVGQGIRGYLYGIRPTDLVAFGTVTVILFSAALLASYLPARRAVKVDPMIALRHE